MKKQAVGSRQKAVADVQKATQMVPGAKWKVVAAANFYSSLPSALCPLPTLRRGISLTEVLISMGVLTLGLLGVAAMFPVGSYYMLKADIADRGSAVAQAAFADLTGKGLLQPDAWVIDQNGTFTNSLIPTFKAYTSVPPYTTATPTVRSQLLNQNYGHAYVIDPLAIAHSIYAQDIATRVAWLARFPNCPANQNPSFNALNPTTLSWQHFTSGAGPSHRLPIRRVTVRDPLTGLALGLRTAESLFQCVDDLSIDLPEEKDYPGQTLWDSADMRNTGQLPLARKSRGDYSWLATISPTSQGGRDALLNSQSSHLYDVSVVVFYKRVLGDVARIQESEGLVRGHVAVTGTSGGEMILNGEAGITGGINPLKNLKVGDHVMVTGPHPESTVASSRLFLQWYRVLSIEQETGFDNDALPEVRVSLRGPDWPWQPVGLPSDSDTANISNDLRIGVFPGAVAVHTKTMRLSGGTASGSPWGVPAPLPPGTPPQKYVTK